MNIYYEKGRMMNMTEEYNRLIGKRVKMQRISAKVSQTELAKELGGNSDAFKQYRKRTRGFDNTQSD
jgi:hypothetical protein